MADLDRLLMSLESALLKSEHRLARCAWRLLSPVFDAAANRFTLRQARLCDEVSAAVWETHPEKAARLHQLAAEFRNLVRHT